MIIGQITQLPSPGCSLPASGLEVQQVSTSLDVFTDTVVFIRYFCATDYLTEVLVKRHGLSPEAARQRAKLIRPHIDLALSYVEQAQQGPDAVAFLPGYYAILNLLKALILVGPLHSQLSKNRWHGATYNGYGKNSHNLLTEEIELKRGGAISLYYWTATGARLTKESQPIHMSDLYPFIADIPAEYLLATGTMAMVWGLTGRQPWLSGDHYDVRVTAHIDPAVGAKVRSLKAFPGFKKVPASTLPGTPPVIALREVDFKAQTPKTVACIEAGTAARRRA